MATLYGPTQVLNGTAETGTTDSWSASNVTVVACNYNSGAYCFKIATTGSLSQTIATLTSSYYQIKVSCWFYTAANITSLTKAHINVTINYSDGTKVVSKIPLEAIKYLEEGTATIEGGLVSIAYMESIIPMDIDKVVTNIVLSINTASLGSSLYIDEIQLCQALGSEKMQDSTGTTIYDENGINMDYLYKFLQKIWIQAADPGSSAKNTDLWIDTDNYSRYDQTTMTGNVVDTIDGNEWVYTGTASLSYTLPSCSGHYGVVRHIKNNSTGILTITGSIDGLASLVLYPGEALDLLSNGSVWCIV